MTGHFNLNYAKNAKNDEFFTQYKDIEEEINAYVEYDHNVFRNKIILLPCDDPQRSNFTKFFVRNFDTLGLKKLISTSFANNNIQDPNYQTTALCQTNNQNCEPENKTPTEGKIFTLSKNTDNSYLINYLRKKSILDIMDINNLEYQHLNGNGDFRSNEITALRDQADIIITNPPFSLFREFLTWILNINSNNTTSVISPQDHSLVSEDVANKVVNKNKHFLIIGNINAVAYKEVFPLIRNNKIWMGYTSFKGGAAYFVGNKNFYNPNMMSTEKYAFIQNNMLYWRVNGVRWFTNLEHGHRHQPLQLMSMKDNIKVSKHREVRNIGYQHYDNYDAIEIPYTDAIPSDYQGVMGVPISFIDKYCPEQFDLLACTAYSDPLHYGVGSTYVNNHKIYARILIKKK